eukprot:TRINITY_DN66309_c5_g5_i1.p1 TRINITY_DN66309_c5_g5~~TRINITY_DN66309_c5_g5_i1.p1  ORF type:complete len:356 (-),score=44.78 TRINITY_DN66309_c5_g5_i1:268-1335(-)
MQRLPLEVTEIIDDFVRSAELSETCKMFWELLGGRWTANYNKRMDITQLIEKCPHQHKLASVSLWGNYAADNYSTATLLALLSSCCEVSSLRHLALNETEEYGEDISKAFPDGLTSALTEEQLEVGLKAFHCLQTLQVNVFAPLPIEHQSYLVPSSESLEVLEFSVLGLPVGFAAFCNASLPRLRRLKLDGYFDHSDITDLFAITPSFANSLQSLDLHLTADVLPAGPSEMLCEGIGKLVNLTELILYNHLPKHCASLFPKTLCKTPPTKLRKLRAVEFATVPEIQDNVAATAEAVICLVSSCPAVVQVVIKLVVGLGFDTDRLPPEFVNRMHEHNFESTDNVTFNKNTQNVEPK